MSGQLGRHIDDLTRILSPVGNASPGLGAKINPPGGGFNPPPKGSPEWLQRQLELSADPAHGNIPGKPKGLREAEVALDMEARGVLPGPIQRAPTGVDAHGKTIDKGDFVDASGQAWDVKNAIDTFPPPGRLQGQPMPPGQPGRYDDTGFEQDVLGELAKGQHVIVDSQYLSAPAKASLEALVARHPEWAGRVVLH